MKRIVGFLAAAVAIPLGLGDSSGCLDGGSVAGECTISGGLLEFAGDVVIQPGARLLLQDAVLRFTDTEGTQEMLVAGTLHARGSAIEAGPGVDLRVHFQGQSTGRLEDSTLSAVVEVEDGARLDVYRSVRVVANLAAPGPAHLTVRDAFDEVVANADLEDAAHETLLLLVQTQQGSDVQRRDPYRFVLTSGSAADHADLVITSSEHEVVLVLDDDDREQPEWPLDALRQDGARLGYSQDGSVVLVWGAADDTRGGAHANRAISHYRIIRNGEEHAGRIQGTSATIGDLAEGAHTFVVEAVDLVGNVARSNPLAILVDRTPPHLDLAMTHDASLLKVAIQATESGQYPSGLSFLRWRIGDGPTTNVHGSGDAQLEDAVALGPGSHRLIVTAEDLAGHRVEEVQEFVLDDSAPTFLARLQPRLPTGAWLRVAPHLHVDVLNPGPSGFGAVHYRVGEEEWQAYTNATPLGMPGEHLVQIRVADAAGNEAITQLRSAYDPEPPTIMANLMGPQGRSGWFVGPVRLQAVAHDAASGLERLEHRIAQSTWRTGGSILLESSGEHRITWRATDAAGNQALDAISVLIDTEPPTPPIVSWSAKDGRVRADWSRAPPVDGVSGIANIIIQREGAAELNLGDGAKGHSAALPNGDHRMRVRVVDAAGNEAATPWATVSVTNGTVGADVAKKVRGEFALRPSAVDGVVEARFFVNGVLLDATASSPHQVVWQTRNVEDGLHHMRIIAVDAQGLHHEESRTYNVRNDYGAILADEALPAGLAVLSSIAALAVGSVGFVRWRRWTL